MSLKAPESKLSKKRVYAPPAGGPAQWPSTPKPAKRRRVGVWSPTDLKDMPVEVAQQALQHMLRQDRTSQPKPLGGPARCPRDYTATELELRSEAVWWMLKRYEHGENPKLDLQGPVRREVIYLAINIFDRFIQAEYDDGRDMLGIRPKDRLDKKKGQQVVGSRLHALGCTCLFMASKHLDVHPLSLHDIVYRGFLGKYRQGTEKQLETYILEQEVKVLNKIRFRMEVVTPLHFLPGALKSFEPALRPNVESCCCNFFDLALLEPALVGLRPSSLCCLVVCLVDRIERLPASSAGQAEPQDLLSLPTSLRELELCEYLQQRQEDLERLTRFVCEAPRLQMVLVQLMKEPPTPRKKASTPTAWWGMLFSNSKGSPPQTPVAVTTPTTAATERSRSSLTPGYYTPA